jgi:hypothetical protein
MAVSQYLTQHSNPATLGGLIALIGEIIVPMRLALDMLCALQSRSSNVPKSNTMQPPFVPPQRVN